MQKFRSAANHGDTETLRLNKDSVTLCLRGSDLVLVQGINVY